MRRQSTTDWLPTATVKINRCGYTYYNSRNKFNETFKIKKPDIPYATKTWLLVLYKTHRISCLASVLGVFSSAPFSLTGCYC